MRRAVAVLGAALALVAVSALGGPADSLASAGISESFSVTYSGAQTLDYAADTDAGIVCILDETAVNHITWTNTNAARLIVSPTGVRVGKVSHVGKLLVAAKGERSVIKGTTTDEPNNKLCDQGQFTGSFDCRAALQPYFGLKRLTLPVFRRGRKKLSVTIRAYSTLRSNYTGPAPPGIPCGGTRFTGSDLFPGGEVWPGIIGGERDTAQVSVPYARLARLAPGKSIRLGVRDGHGLPPAFYLKHSSCGFGCVVYASTRRGAVVLTRLK